MSSTEISSTIKEKLKLQRLYEEQTRAPFIDALTGLFNYGFFSVYLGKEIHRSKRTGEKFTLCLIDIDEFAAFNKKHGEIEGDIVLKSVGSIVAQNIRSSDIAARFSGGLFALIMTGTNISSATIGAERILREIENFDEKRITVSAGLATCPTHGLDREILISNAKDALTDARIKGGNRVCVYETTKKSASCPKNRILIVDDEPLNLKLFKAILQPFDYEVITAESGTRALSLIKKVEVDLVLLDVMMPELNGFEVCRILKSRDDTRLIPVILVTGLNELEDKVKGIEAGADDFLSKPPNKFELTTRIKSLLRTRNLNKSLTSIENVLISLAKAVEAKDKYTQGHIERVSSMALSVGRFLDISNQDLKALRMGCILHDIGKISVPREILNKSERLTEDEWEMLRLHPIIGYKICLPLKKSLGAALNVIRHHHEKLDGSGYPDGLKGNQISTLARIAAIVDIYDALTTNRPYRKAMAREKAISWMRVEAEKGKLDADLLKEFIKRTTRDES